MASRLSLSPHLPALPRGPRGVRQLAACLIAGFVISSVNTPVLAASQRDQVLWSVVVTHAVDVMRVLILPEVPSNLCFENQPVFGYVATHGLLMQCARVIRLVDVDVAVPNPTSSEPAAIWSSRPWSVPDDEWLWVPEKVSGLSARVGRDLRLLPASALAQRADRLWWQKAAFEVSLSSGFQCFWCLELVAWQEPHRESLASLCDLESASAGTCHAGDSNSTINGVHP